MSSWLEGRSRRQAASITADDSGTSARIRGRIRYDFVHVGQRHIPAVHHDRGCPQFVWRERFAHCQLGNHDDVEPVAVLFWVEQRVVAKAS